MSHALGVPLPVLSPAEGWEVVLSLGCLSQRLNMPAHTCSHVFASMGV